MKRNRKVLPYLDLPIQHCNDEILHNMNRRSTRAELLEVIGRLRAAIPGITLRTTLIAGFPGETEAQFEELCEFVKEVEFDRLGCFAYSAEENTKAALMEGQLDQETKDRRAEIVMDIQTGIMSRKQAEKVGQTLRVICDGWTMRAACTSAAPWQTPPKSTAPSAWPAKSPSIPATSTTSRSTRATSTTCTARWSASRQMGITDRKTPVRNQTMGFPAHTNCYMTA